MKETTFILLIFLSGHALFAQDIRPGETAKVSGKIFSAYTMDPVAYAYIFDMNRNIGVAADASGEFSILIYKSDTLRFSAVGFEYLKISLADSAQKNSYYLTVRLKPQATWLEELRVYAYDPMKGFRRDTTHTTKYQFSTGAAGKGAAPAENVIASGYISQFADLFNRHAREEKKLNKVINREAEETAVKNHQDSVKMVIDSRYNKLVISRITGLSGIELDEFIREYRPANLFILTASDYDLALQIVNSFRDYQKKHGLQVDLDEILRRAVFKN